MSLNSFLILTSRQRSLASRHLARIEEAQFNVNVVETSMIASLPILIFETAIWAIFAVSLKFYFRSENNTNTTISFLGIAGAIAFFIIIIASLDPVDNPWALSAGIVLMASSAGLFLWTAVHASHARPAIAFSGSIPKQIFTDGPFRYVRHPFYTSYCLYWVGGGLISGLPFGPLPFLIMLPFYIAAAKGEEEQLTKGENGQKYKAYRDRTGFFWPRFPVST